MSPSPIALIPYYGPGAHEHYQSVSRSRIPWVASLMGLASIDAARSLLLEQALSSPQNFDVFVFIDSDMGFSRADFDGIVQSAHEEQAIVGGAYLTRMFLDGRQRINSPPHVHEHMTLKFFDEGMLYPASHLGMGFTAIPRSQVERMIEYHQMKKCFFTHDGNRAPAYPLFMPMIHEGIYRFEDHAFCIRAVQAGVPILCDTRPALVHYGEHGHLLTDLRIRSQHDPSFVLEIGKIAPPAEQPIG